MSVLEQSVTKGEGDAEGTWDFECPGIQGSLCGEPGGANFRSVGWPTKKTAMARGAQHFAEHKGEAVTPELHEFRVEHGLTVVDGKAVSLEDI